MRRFFPLSAGAALIIWVGQALLFAPGALRAASGPSPVSVLSADLSKITGPDAMCKWLDALYAESVGAKQEGRFTFELQERILKKAGEAVGRILELEKPADPAAWGKAFTKNEALLQFIQHANEEVIEEIQEEKLDKVEDIQAFLDSPEWQMPHRMISLARYWMSWIRYYRSFLYPRGSSRASSLLNEAIGGFSLTLFDLDDPSIVAKSLFGRALCFKELKKYKKAVEDLDSIARNVRHNDPLYIWSLYEQARIAYRRGRNETALANLDKLDTEVEQKTVARVLGEEHRRLRERVVLEPRAAALQKKLDKEQDKTGEDARRLCYELHGALKRLAMYDAAYATRLYRLVAGHSGFFASLPYEDLGPVANLAMADCRFKEGRYAEAVKRYRFLWGASDGFIRQRLDELYFRTAYADCQIGRWKEALSCLERLHREFPRSELVDKAVCLEYVAAAGAYKRNPGQANYSRYIASTRRYLRKCPHPRDRDGAHFLLGEDYLKKGKPAEARREFTAVAEGSPHYWPARYYMARADLSELERQIRKGGRQSAATKRRFRVLEVQFARFQELAQSGNPPPAIAELAPRMTLLQARLFACSPQASCGRITRTLKGFETRFPGSRPLWLEAMRLRLACYDKHRLIDASKGHLRLLSRKYPEDEGLWNFLGEWSERYDREAKGLRREGDSALSEAYAEMALMLYTEMAHIASGQARYGKHLDAVEIRRGKILLALGRQDAARRIYEELLEKTPGSAEALYHLGEIYEAQGRWDAALEVWRKYSKGLEAGSDDWLDARYRIAQAHSRMGKKKEACDVLTMIRVLHPNAGNAGLRKKILELQRAVCSPAGRTAGT